MNPDGWAPKTNADSRNLCTVEKHVALWVNGTGCRARVAGQLEIDHFAEDGVLNYV
jgi:hypothetical protein